MKNFLIFLCLLFTIPAWGATYHVATDGSGDFTTIADVVSYDKVIGFSPGDFIAFRRGDKWRETLQCWSSGSAGHPIIYGSYGVGVEPIIDGSDIVTGWSDEGDGSWSNSTYNEPAQVWEDNIRLTYRDYLQNETVNGTGQFGYNVNKTVIRCSDDANPNTHVIELGARDVGIWLSHNGGTMAKNRNHDLILENITFQKVAGTYTSGTGGSQMKDSLGDILIYQIMDSQGINNTIRNLISRQCGGGRAYNTNEEVLPTVWSANIEFWRATGGQVYNCSIYDGTKVLLNMETLENDGEHYTAYNNKIYDGHDSREKCIGLQITGAGGNFYNNNISDVDIGLEYGGHDYSQKNIYRNSFENITTYGMNSYNHTGKLAIASNNIFQMNGLSSLYISRASYITDLSENITLYHNTYDCAALCRGLTTGTGLGAVNNIIYKNNIVKTVNRIPLEVQVGDNVTLDYNDYYFPSSVNFAIWKGTTYTSSQFSDYQSATSQDLHSIAADPKLTDVYKIGINSPCVDKGVDTGIRDDYDGQVRFRGSAPDIGAYEYQYTRYPRKTRWRPFQ